MRPQPAHLAHKDGIEEAGSTSAPSLSRRLPPQRFSVEKGEQNAIAEVIRHANISVDAPSELSPQVVAAPKVVFDSVRGWTEVAVGLVKEVLCVPEWALEPPAQLSPPVLLDKVQVDELSSPHQAHQAHALYQPRLSLFFFQLKGSSSSSS